MTWHRKNRISPEQLAALESDPLASPQNWMMPTEAAVFVLPDCPRNGTVIALKYGPLLLP